LIVSVSVSMKIQSHGIEIACDVDGGEGEGPWLILAHSLATHRGLWQPQIAVLRGRFRVLSFDMRGHGESDAPEGAYSFEQLAADVIGLMDALKIETASYVGLSIGGMVGQFLGLLAPQRFERLVLAGTTGRIPPEGAALWDGRIKTVREQGMGVMVESTLERWFTPPFRAARPDLMTRIGDMIRATPVAGYVGCGRALQTFDVTARLAAITTPTLVLAGAEDTGTPVAASRMVAEAIPGARFEIIPAASHLCCLEQPEAFNRLLLEFL
jgi:3-oxoadipate enol-lactonase